MSQANLTLAIFLVFFAIVFPVDFLLLGGLLNAKIKLHLLNLKMWWMSYFMWRRLNADMKKEFGIEMPEFKYVHIWDRKQP